jgi:hypothetical protein
MGPPYKPQPANAIRVTGGDAERAATANAHHRQLAEAPEPAAPKLYSGETPAAVPLAIAPASTIAPPASATPEKPQGGNRLTKALGKVNPFRKRTKPAEGDADKSALPKY